VSSPYSGFPPIESASARVLILGSLPGVISIERQEYYAQPRNAFWKIMGDLFGFAPSLPYGARIAALIESDIAVWDVCAAAHRPGSLDSAIRTKSVEANDFDIFLSAHPKVGLICFNGAKASELFEAQVAPSLRDEWRKITRAVLPSTSPAHASLSYETKKSAWDIVRRAAAS
jgi:double-stranded uracil-DNA glycosylase